MTSISVLSSLLQLKMMNAAVSNNINIGNDYKALVCIFLQGGNDSFNMLAPWTNGAHQNYLTARQHLALPKTELMPIPTNNSANMNHVGVHHTMPEIEDAYRRSDLAFLANVGTLVRPTTIQDFNNGLDLPHGLFSHREQQVSWQTSVPNSRSAKGWVGRMSELINEDASDLSVAMNVSVGGASLLQTGPNSSPFRIGSDGANDLGRYNSRADIKAAYDTTLDHQYSNVIKQHYNYKNKEIIEKNAFYNDVVTGTSSPFAADAFPNTNLGKQMEQVALSINARETLGSKRQTFFVSFGPFDHHSNLLANQEELLPQLSQAMGAFNQAMKTLGLHDEVMTYTASDFGRTTSSNSTGTDHAWGGNQMLMGGAVNGKKVHGLYPDDLRAGSMGDIDTGRGRFIPTTAVDELHAELALWYGLGLNDLPTILPNINNFNYSPKGFINM